MSRTFNMTKNLTEFEPEFISEATLLLAKRCSAQDWLHLSRNRLDNLHKIISQARYSKYPMHKRRPKYYGLSRAFSKQQQKQFLKTVKKEKFYMAFQLGFLLGLRGGEIIQVKEEHIDFENKKIRVRNVKNGSINFLHLHKTIYKLLKNYCEKHKKQIQAHEGYLIYSENPVQKRNHVSVVGLQNYFRKCRKKAGLNKCYSRVLHFPSGKLMSQYLISLHSLRHTAITNFYDYCHDAKLTQSFARHRDFSTTMDTYVHIDQNKVELISEKAFK